MRIKQLAIPLAFAVAASACHHAPPAVAVQPQIDSSALEQERQDSIARADEAARAREAAARRAEQRRADSLAAVQRKSQEIGTELANMIHFDFNRSTVRPGDVQVLDEKLPILRDNPQLKIRVAGNCDERGSDEYNLALGNRRAIAAKQYLVAHGIDGSRIEVMSYGKEKPIDPGHNDEAWAKNRNDEFENLTTNVVLR